MPNVSAKAVKNKMFPPYVGPRPMLGLKCLKVNMTHELV